MDEENGKKFCALYGVEDTDEDFSFAFVVPPPAEVDDDGKWNDWRTENWGVKWDAADIGNGISVSCLTEDGELDFETPWAPPIGVYEKMAADGLEFTFGWESDSIDDVLVGGGEAKGGRLAYGIDLGRLAEKLEDDGVDADEVGEPEESSLECWQDEYGNFGDSFGDFVVLKTGFWGERVYAYPVKAALEGKEAAPAPICKMPSVYRAYYTEEYDEDEDNLDFLFVDLADDCDRVFLLGADGARVKSLAEIDYGAFEGCSSLSSVEIPSSVTEIGDCAFSGCESLSSVEFGGTMAQWDAVKGKMWLLDYSPAKSVKCADGEWRKSAIVENGVLVEYTDKDAASVEIPEGVTEIGGLAFRDCSSLESVSIPSSVAEIGEYAFFHCSSLSSVEFGGTAAQWEAVEKGDGWHYNASAKFVKCSDGEAEL